MRNKGFIFRNCYILGALVIVLVFFFHGEKATAKEYWPIITSSDSNQAGELYFTRIPFLTKSSIQNNHQKFNFIKHWQGESSRQKVYNQIGHRGNKYFFAKAQYFINWTDKYPKLANYVNKYKENRSKYYPKGYSEADSDSDNTDSEDSDSDGTDNTSPLDADHDGIPDSSDQCPGNDDTVDIDNDGTPDCIDNIIDSDKDGYSDATDCAPNDSAINPGATDIPCDGIDQNCSGSDEVNATCTDTDNDGYSDDTDCAPTNPAINPGASEVCDGVDNNCSGEIDEGLNFTSYYQDSDGDLFGNSLVSQTTCDGTPAGYVEDSSDCNDSDSGINPAAAEVACDGIDQNCSGSDETNATCIDTDNDGYSDATDCAPTNPAINPGASEVCDGIDNNCSGEIDEGLHFTSYYQDSDGDLFGNSQVSQTTCNGAPAGYVEDSSDCNDNNAGINPDAAEVACDGIDQNCSGSDETNATCIDTDNDGYSDATDCAPNDASINPGASEVCDGIDNNCSGEIDEGLHFTSYYQDSDGDLFGNSQVSQTTCNGAPAGYVEDSSDCNDSDSGINPAAAEVACDGIDQNCSGSDETNATCIDTDNDGYSDATDCAPTNPAINPGASEVCDGIDNNCSGEIDEGLNFTSYYQDSDGDLFGNSLVSQTTCDGAPAGYVEDSSDCNDNNAGINPDATEVACDGIDQNCSGSDETNATCIDTDNDGYSDATDCAPTNPAINPGASEVCDGVDNNCSGGIDEGLNFTSYYQDSDGDLFGNSQVSQTTCNGAPAGYVEDSSDCNDSDSGINPDAAEVACDGIDQNCSGADEVNATCTDTDNDGYSDATDCAPTNPAINPGASDIPCDGIDQNCSGSDEVDATCTDTDNDGYTDATDCAPDDPAINPGASEVCDGIDNNCSGEIDEGLNFTSYFQDSDGDLFGNSLVSQTTCDGAPNGYVEDSSDCNDSNAGINPAAAEEPCDGIDQNCSGSDAVNATCTDSDNDGYSDATDCAPTNPAINPGASEVCDGIDNNCSGGIDEGLNFTSYYQDSDGDLFGNSQVSQTTCNGAPAGYVEDSSDCNDNNAGINPVAAEEPCDGIDQNCSGSDAVNATCTDSDNDGYSDATDCAPNDANINPGAAETCDGIDNNCSGEIDEGLNFTSYYQDSDGDLFGNSLVSQTTCNGAPAGYVEDSSDCNDNNAGINPVAAEEPCDGIDQNCSGSDAVNATCTDSDNDGYSDATDCAPNDANINPGAAETCDGIDNNCSGTADDGLVFTTYYFDNDNDLFGDAGVSETTCDGNSMRYVENSSDCNDTDASIYPSATEVVCDGIDQDCSGADEVDATCTDTDGDTVPDSEDLCPGEDDTIDVNNDSIPDCFQANNEPPAISNFSAGINTLFTGQGTIVSGNVSDIDGDQFDVAWTASCTPSTDENVQSLGSNGDLYRSGFTAPSDIGGLSEVTCEITLTATDSLGNSSSATAIITVQSPDEICTIRGKLYGTTGAPAANQSVTLTGISRPYDRTVTTDGSGNYAFDDVSCCELNAPGFNGTLKVTFTHDDPANAQDKPLTWQYSREVQVDCSTVSSGETCPRDIALPTVWGTVQGTYYDATGNGSNEDRFIGVSNEEGSLDYFPSLGTTFQLTNQNNPGSYGPYAVPLGETTFTTCCTSNSMETFNVLEKGQLVNKDIGPGVIGSITGTTFNNNGSLDTSTTVQLDFSGTPISTNFGGYRFDNVSGNVHSVNTATRIGWGSINQKGEEAVIDIMGNGCEVRGRLYNQLGQPYLGASSGDLKLFVDNDANAPEIPATISGDSYTISGARSGGGELFTDQSPVVIDGTRYFNLNTCSNPISVDIQVYPDATCGNGY